jgi:hypothetical protein
MRGDLEVSQSLRKTRRQIIRNGLNALANGGVPGEQDGEAPASFEFEASLDGPEISESSTYGLKLLRRRSEVVLEWSGKLAFARIPRHPTRDPEPCLQAELEIPRAEHELR